MKKLALALILLGGCDGGGNDAPRQVKKIEVTGEGSYIGKLRALKQSDRDLVLRRAVIDSGQRCRRVVGSQEIGTYENLTAFAVNCEPQRAWAVFVAPNGDTQVRSCEHVQQLGLPACPTAQSAGSSSSKG
ncbi:MAG TPA: hypothetical protein VGD10_11375 [Allosphingosinicella sp.]|uniref:hypothetical protein n=1 Tax=Allosphingosinicella sp. TaxID=2823234 RepID=UPI002ED8432D